MIRPLIVFDVGSTLIHPNFSTLADWLADRAIVRVATDIVERAFRQALAGDPFAFNDHNHQADTFFRLCGCSLSQHAFWPAWWEEITQAGGAGSWLYAIVDVDANAVLEQLKLRGYRLVAASNSNGTLHEELDSFALLKFFEATYDSADVGSEKPAAEFYAHVRRSSNAMTRIHVGNDLIKDFIGPLTSGFQRALLYDPADVYVGLPPGAKIRRLSEIEGALGSTT